MGKFLFSCMAALTACVSGAVLIGGFKGHFAEYKVSDAFFSNPLMGYAPAADNPDLFPESSLVYIDVTWRELEPQKGVYAFDIIEEQNHINKWKEQGKHAVFRFVCDVPSKKSHMDIPDWLYSETGGAGQFYSISYGQGFAPDYNNQSFIAAHERAVQALGNRYGQDSFISYVELGSLGHWGEWHVKENEGLPPIPMQEVRRRYILPYINAFPNAKIMMRRPFAEVGEYGFGIFNDMAGEPDSTAEWLDWIQNGGTYNQTGENCILPAPDAWKIAPIGGEFTSSISMDEMLGSQLNRTKRLLKESHTTFLGPKIPDLSKQESLQSGSTQILNSMGYRLRIQRMTMKRPIFDSKVKVKLSWQNDGAAPFYFDWPVYLYVMDLNGTAYVKYPVDIKLQQISGEEEIVSETVIPADVLKDDFKYLGLGIEDPMTGIPAVNLTMETPRFSAISVLYERTQ